MTELVYPHLSKNSAPQLVLFFRPDSKRSTGGDDDATIDLDLVVVRH